MMQTRSRSRNLTNHWLYSIAEGQAGFFTARQAQSFGFSASSHTYHVRDGSWVREFRGIYRLSEFPAVLRPELMRWHLWSMNRLGQAQGVYSHSSALSLYLTPEKATPPDARPELEMTVPTRFRRSGATPEGLTLHYTDLPTSDIASQKKYRLTTPLRTILDLEAANAMPREESTKALLEMVERGLITREQVEDARIPEAAKLQLEELLGRKKR